MTNNVYAGRSFLILWLIVFSPLCRAASRFNGIWQGTYNSLHYERPPQTGDDLEQRNGFELRLYERRGIVTGEFSRRVAASPSGTPQSLRPEISPLSILNGKIFDERACFDVVNEYGDMRWCVIVRDNKLTGTWSGGPEGGPVLGGAGAGVRFYEISGRKIAR